MNLEEILNAGDGLLHHTDWVLSDKFPDSLSVVGWSGTWRRGGKGDRVYIIHCTECAKDPELFGEGYFKTYKFSMTGNKTQNPCGCAHGNRLNQSQHWTLCKRKAIKLGLEFIGWEGEYCGLKTRVLLKCNLHGVWSSSSVKSFINQENTKGNCRQCGDVVGALKRTKETDEFINRFKESRKFHKDTIFNFIGHSRRDAKNYRFWEVICGRCYETYQAKTYSLDQGQMLCCCSLHENQRFCYINIVYKYSYPVALKFGISVNPVLRVKGVNSKTNFNVRLDKVFQFERPILAKRAEESCKTLLKPIKLTKEELPDGWSETTSLENYDKIIEIFKSFGGYEVDKAMKYTYIED